ncbi:MAG: hypothetical protein IIC13_14755 [SAR324 cluster bacterium]|nr:hypothetical protein [SAR324 cluster bacterium]
MKRLIKSHLSGQPMIAAAKMKSPRGGRMARLFSFAAEPVISPSVLHGIHNPGNHRARKRLSPATSFSSAFIQTGTLTHGGNNILLAPAAILGFLYRADHFFNFPLLFQAFR